MTETSQPIYSQKYKSELCHNFNRGSGCPFGPGCIYAHGFNELQAPWRPWNYKTKPCWSWAKSGMCSFGPRCLFYHDIQEKKDNTSKLTKLFDPNPESKLQ